MKPTPAQADMLRNIYEKKDATYGMSGRSAMGGATATWAALHRKGWMLNGELTPSGRALVEKECSK